MRIRRTIILAAVLCSLTQGCTSYWKPKGDCLSDWAPYFGGIKTKEDLDAVLKKRWTPERLLAYAKYNPPATFAIQALMPVEDAWYMPMHTSESKHFLASWQAVRSKDGLRYIVILEIKHKNWLVEIGDFDSLKRLPYIVVPPRY